MSCLAIKTADHKRFLATFLINLFAVTAMPAPHANEANSACRALQNQADKHWQSTAVEGDMFADDGVRIRYAQIYRDDARALIVIASGRTETYLKYRDLVYQLNNKGYSVLIYDHRGQGFSERLLRDPRKGYVGKFDDYVTDLKKLFDLYITDKMPQKRILLSHSMGGAVSALYASHYPDDFDAFIMASPMLGLPIGKAAKWKARLADTVETWLFHLLDREPGYIPFAVDFSSIPFEGNSLTHSRERYTATNTLFQKHPEAALGNPTIHWVDQSYRAFGQIFTADNTLAAPVLLLQAGNDRVVSNSAQDAFCHRIGKYCYGGEPFVIAGAKHELFNETDKYRDRAISKIFEFIADIE